MSEEEAILRITWDNLHEEYSIDSVTIKNNIYEVTGDRVE